MRDRWPTRFASPIFLSTNYFQPCRTENLHVDLHWFTIVSIESQSRHFTCVFHDLSLSGGEADKSHVYRDGTAA